MVDHNTGFRVSIDKMDSNPWYDRYSWQAQTVDPDLSPRLFRIIEEGTAWTFNGAQRKATNALKRYQRRHRRPQAFRYAVFDWDPEEGTLFYNQQASL
jgi:hypothetical protein